MVDTGISGSFIPHDTSVAPPARSSGGGGLSDLLLLCAIVLLVASAALAIGVFLYGQYLTTESSAKLSQLERAKAAFQPALVQQFTRLDDRMHAADQILSRHLAPSRFFSALEAATLQTVSFQTLDIQSADSSNLSIAMAGVAQSVNSIALQADLFSKNGVITSPIFSNITRQADGVHFKLSATVNSAAIRFSGEGGSQETGTQNVSAPAQSTSPFDARTATSTQAPKSSATPQN
ncbi:hypothetical protein HY971_03665 [Candidatus Kaiserbacteria bacterium]|nr:hypothetical protein [Candidatus Kaiserbacteria bacterium]